MGKSMKKRMRKQDTTGFRNEKEGAKMGKKAGKTAPYTLDLLPVIIMSDSVKNRYTNDEKA